MDSARQIGDPVTSVVMGLPEDLPCRTKGQLAIDILAEAFADSVRLDFVCGDEVYGSCTELREYCEDRDQAYVLWVPCSFRLALPGGLTLTCQQAEATKPGHAGTTSEHASPAIPQLSWSASEWLLPY
jgi:hypothetical protein